MVKPKKKMGRRAYKNFLKEKCRKIGRQNKLRKLAKEGGTPAESLEIEWLSCQTDVNKLVQRKGAIKGSLFSNEEIGWLADVTDEIEEAKDTTNAEDTDSDNKNDLPIAEPLHIVHEEFEVSDIKENVDSDIELDMKKNEDASKHIPLPDWVITKLLCRCCHAEGDFTSVQKEAADENMFEDMLSSCFNIQLLPVSRAERSCLRALCALCAARLRDAHAFSQQVRACEQRFYELYTNKCIKVPVSEEVVEIKNEELPDGGDDSDICADDDNIMPENRTIDQQSVTRSGRKKVETKKKAEPKRKKQTPKAKKDPKTTRQQPTTYSEYWTRLGDMYKCTRCEKMYRNRYSFHEHFRRIHLKLLEEYKCDNCQTTFRTKTQRTLHKLEKHNIDERHKCNACDKIFNSKQHFKLHESIYHMLGEKIKCSMCDYECYHKALLRTHLVKHSTSKDFHCKYCKKAFLRKENLALHERIHTGDKRKACAECGQAFVQKASLNYHMTKYHPGVNF